MLRHCDTFFALKEMTVDVWFNDMTMHCLNVDLPQMAGNGYSNRPDFGVVSFI